MRLPPAGESPPSWPAAAPPAPAWAAPSPLSPPGRPPRPHGGRPFGRRDPGHARGRTTPRRAGGVPRPPAPGAPPEATPPPGNPARFPGSRALRKARAGRRRPGNGAWRKATAHSRQSEENAHCRDRWTWEWGRGRGEGVGKGPVQDGGAPGRGRRGISRNRAWEGVSKATPRSLPGRPAGYGVPQALPGKGGSPCSFLPGSCARPRPQEKYVW